MPRSKRYRSLPIEPDAEPELWRDLLSHQGVCGDESFLADCHHDVAVVYRLWDGKRQGRGIPARADFDPLEIPPHILPGILLIDVAHDPLHFRYRLVGTRDVGQIGRAHV